MSQSAEESIRARYQKLSGELDERTRRLWAANEALVLGHGGVSLVSRGTGLAGSTIRAGMRELERPEKRTVGSIRRPGGGRRRLTELEPGLKDALDALVEPLSRGDPESPLRWTTKSTRKLAAELKQQGYSISHSRVGDILHELKYSLQANQKTHEGMSHPERDGQFKYISRQVVTFQSLGEPVVSVDAKKKELVGDFANRGREYQKTKQPEKVRMHDFADPELGKAIPYGVYDLTKNNGWVSVGVDHDTAQFAVETLRRWWQLMGKPAYPEAREILITADGGGSNGSRPRLYKIELQKFADETGLEVTVCHFPPGTSKWNKIEHRMFSQITQNWRGRPLVSREVIVNLIAGTTTETGLHIEAGLDLAGYPTGIRITAKQMKTVNLCRAEFHGNDWNYTILPHENPIE